MLAGVAVVTGILTAIADCSVDCSVQGADCFVQGLDKAASIARSSVPAALNEGGSASDGVVVLR